MNDLEKNVSIVDASGLANNVLFLQVHFGRLGNTRSIGGDIFETDADKSLLRATKQLLVSPELEAIRKADLRMYQWLYNSSGLAVPCSFDAFCIPKGSLINVRQKLEDYRLERIALVDAFLSVYAAQAKETGSKLASLSDLSDYPPIEVVKAKFTFGYVIFSFGLCEGLKAISEGLYQEMSDKLNSQLQNAGEEITAVFRQTALDLLTNLQDQLKPSDDTGKEKTLSKNSVDKVKKFLDNFSLKNVTDDKQLAGIVEQVKSLLDGTDLKANRSNAEFKAKMRDGLASVTAELSTMVQEKTGRKFLFDE